MTIAELIAELSRYPKDCEIEIMTHSGCARPPVIVRVNADAWKRVGGVGTAGLRTPSNAFLIRPRNEIIGGIEDLTERDMP
jgi:hypothetical protein